MISLELNAENERLENNSVFQPAQGFFRAAILSLVQGPVRESESN